MSQKVIIQVFNSNDSSTLSNVSVWKNEKIISKTNKEGIARLPVNKKVKYKFTLDGYYSSSLLILKSVNIYLLPNTIRINEFKVISKKKKGGISNLQLKKTEKMFLYHAKKTEKIKVGENSANLATNNIRQIYQKIAGLNSIESNSNGLGTEIGVRGLSPERSSNLNIRQNGYDISADALGYPDAYYVPPAQCVDVIESVRGAGALQYGTQFGGMINYRIKRNPLKKDGLGFHTEQTIGSYNFFNTFNAVYGKRKGFSFYSFFGFKKGDDWKVNSNFNANNIYFQGKFKLNKKSSLNIEFMHYYYLAKQPGGLTDAMFKDNPAESIRNRNWFSVNWNLPSVSYEWIRNKNTKIESKFFGLYASRKALGFLGNITRVDNLGDRDLLFDNYINFGNETKLMKRYNLLKHRSLLVIGSRVYRGNTQKRQGSANDKAGADFNYLTPKNLQGSDFKFPNYNLSFFGENVLFFNKKTSLILGARLEKISTNANGYYRIIQKDLAENILIDTSIIEFKKNNRSFVLFSGGLSYELNNKLQFYTNLSQNYRAINFNDLRISNTNLRVDPNLKDETGYNADIGIRGKWGKMFSYDISLFYLKYNNRIGFILKSDTVWYNIYRYRTNISSSRNIGMESIFEIDFLRFNKNISLKKSLKGFVNYSLINGKYIDTEVPAYNNNLVEFIPSNILKTGLSIKLKELLITYQYSYTSKQYTDATNSTFSANALSGIIPSYTIMDLSMAYRWKQFSVQININNLSNNIYFSKRATGYPGPGIIAAPPRMLYLTVGYKL